MDILDNIMYATFFRKLTNNQLIESDFVPNATSFPHPVKASATPPPYVTVYSYAIPDKLKYCTYPDPAYVEKGIQRHWFDVDAKQIYADASGNYSNFLYSSGYHLIYAYLIENTRIFQIFERIIEKYLNDEELGIANTEEVFYWIQNSERLFYKSDTPKATNLRSYIRPSADASRRNAYHRMFGMDLAFGDVDSKNTSIAYNKAKAANLQFVLIFERYLSEIWQGYINARNTSGANTADVNILVELAQQLREMLIARRGNLSSYAKQNLSREEYSSVLMSSWFTFIISWDSPIVTYLNSQSSTIGERLMKIGMKAGVPAHSKCQSLFDMAASAATILLTVEAGGVLDDAAWVQHMLSSLSPNAPNSPIHKNFMTDFLTVINNWEKATGHKIKNTEANLTATVRVQPTMPAAKPSQPAMN